MFVISKKIVLFISMVGSSFYKISRANSIVPLVSAINNLGSYQFVQKNTSMAEFYHLSPISCTALMFFHSR